MDEQRNMVGFGGDGGAHYDFVVESMLEQLNSGLSFDELFKSIYDKLTGIIPYNRIAVALLEEPERLLRLTSCRSDGDLTLKVGYAAHLNGSTLERLLKRGSLGSSMICPGICRQDRNRLPRNSSCVKA